MSQISGAHLHAVALPLVLSLFLIVDPSNKRERNVHDVPATVSFEVQRVSRSRAGAADAAGS